MKTDETREVEGRGVAGTVAVVVLVLVAGMVLSLVRPDLFRPEYWKKKSEQVVAPSTRGVGPAPTLKRGPTFKVKGKKMGSWTTIAPQPGDPTYRGTFKEKGTFNGKPAYVLHEGEADERWLWFLLEGEYPWGFAHGGEWMLSSVLGVWEVTGYRGWEGAVLPANPWMLVNTAGGQPAPLPAPTLGQPEAVRPQIRILCRSGPHLRGVA